MPPGSRQALYATIATFGGLLKYLRRQARLTQRDLGIAVGYGEAQISRLEHDQRPPDLTALAALFVPALALEESPEVVSRLLELAAAARGESALEPVARRRTERVSVEAFGSLESVPLAVPFEVPRPAELARLREHIARGRGAILYGLPGTGKTALAAQLARAPVQDRPVFWMTFIPSVNTSVEAILHQLALFLLVRGHAEAAVLLGESVEGGQAPALNAQVNTLTALLAGEDALLCFDNAHFLRSEPDVLQALRHLLASGLGRYLLVSREILDIGALAQLPLGGLQVDEARELIDRHELTLAPALAGRLMTAVDRSPMLLQLACSQLRDGKTEPAGFVRQLEARPQLAAGLVDAVVGDLQEYDGLLGLLSVFREPVDLSDESLVGLLGAEFKHIDLGQAFSLLTRRQVLSNPAQAGLPPLIREAVYERLSANLARKRRMHKLAAQWYERASENVVEAAHHYVEADELERAAETLADQAQAILNRGRGAAAVEVVDGILSRLEGRKSAGPPLRQVLTVRGDLLVSTERSVEAEANYRDAYALALKEGLALVPRIHLALRLGNCLLQRAKAPEGAALLEEAQRDLGQGDAPLQAQVEAALARASLMLSRFDQAEGRARRALDLCDGFVHAMPKLTARIHAQAHSVIGVVQHIHRDHPSALRHLNRAVDAARLAGMPNLEYRCLLNLGNVHLEAGHFDDALAAYDGALAGFESVGDRYAAARVESNLGGLYHAQGQLADALTHCDRSIAIKLQLGDRQGLAHTENARALVLLSMGRLDEALGIVERILPEARDLGETRSQAFYLDTLLLIRLAQGDPDGARTALESAEAIPNVAEDGRLSGYLQNHRAAIELACGNSGPAAVILNEEPPPGAGPEVALEREMLRGVLSLAQHDPQAAVRRMRALSVRARGLGFGLYELYAVRLKEICGQDLSLPIILRQIYLIRA